MASLLLKSHITFFFWLPIPVHFQPIFEFLLNFPSLFLQVISSMRVLMTEDSNNAESNSFLLDDNSRWEIILRVVNFCHPPSQILDKKHDHLISAVLSFACRTLFFYLALFFQLHTLSLYRGPMTPKLV